MKGTGLLTNPVYVQDLAIWLPLFTWPPWRAGTGGRGGASSPGRCW